ncbi:MAG TPA: hypothetical protein HA362_06715 [Nanoarchaeota archaeon]|nr:hypothetical protein [Nanoarchaeota archaeon]
MQNASAAGISPGKITLNFFPETSQTIEYRITGYDDFAITNKECSFLEYNNDSEWLETGETRFTVTIRFPKTLPPGANNCGFMVMHGATDPEAPETARRGIGAVSQVGAVIQINVPLKGKYARISLHAENANKGEPVYFQIKAENLGEYDLNSLNARIEVADIEGKIIQRLVTEPFSIPKFGAAEVWKKMETTNFVPAKYKATAIVDYSGAGPAVAETAFLVGKMFVDFLGFEANATSGRINPITANIESWWGNPVENVYAEFKMQNGSGKYAGEFKTESADLEPWQKASLLGYWDATGLEPGNYTAGITLKYKGGKTETNGTIILHSPAEAKTEFPFSKAKDILSSPIFIIVLMLILLANILVWFMQKQGKAKGEKE